jgi:hypothetical protein
MSSPHRIKIFGCLVTANDGVVAMTPAANVAAIKLRLNGVGIDIGGF